MSAHEKSDIPSQIYSVYNLLYNNVTFRAVRKALEEAATYGHLNDDKSNTDTEFIDEIMNQLIDASLERLGAERYRGAEAALMHKLRPLVSNFSGLVQRHLSNFGPAPETSARPSSELLQVTRAELHGMHYDMAREKSANAQIAASWLRAAALLTGAAGELIHETEYPITANRYAARAKILAAFEALEGGIAACQTENYPLPDDLDDVLACILRLLTPSQFE